MAERNSESERQVPAPVPSLIGLGPWLPGRRRATRDEKLGLSLTL